jgi:CDP-glucose 4,6-dehydratase
MLVAPNPFRGRRILVTGHTGFKGSWLVRWLALLGARVSGLALAPQGRPALFDEAGLQRTMDSHLADLRSLEPACEIIGAERPALVFHLAAQSLVRAGYADPVGTYATNVMGTAHVLEAARRAQVQAVVVVTSDKCYAPAADAQGHREDDPLGGPDPYSSSKACAELLATCWRESFGGAGGPRIASVRAGNVIGGGDWADDRLVPDLVRAALGGEQARIRNPHAIRPWQHVLEPLAGYLRVGARLLAGDRRVERPWNFGPAAADMAPVSRVADALCDRLGGQWTTDAGVHPAEAAVLRLDSQAAIEQLDWRPRWPLETTLDRVADWYRLHHQGADALALMDAQIQAYGNPLEDAR